jgi:hypothetical protein
VGWAAEETEKEQKVRLEHREPVDSQVTWETVIQVGWGWQPHAELLLSQQ